MSEKLDWRLFVREAYRLALEHLADAESLWPEWDEVWRDQARVLLRLGRADEAARLFTETLALEPRFQAARDRLAELGR